MGCTLPCAPTGETNVRHSSSDGPADQGGDLVGESSQLRGVWGSNTRFPMIDRYIASLRLAIHRLLRLGWPHRSTTGRRSVSQLQLKNAVLRHQVRVLRRNVRRPELKDNDRAFLAAASRALA